MIKIIKSHASYEEYKKMTPEKKKKWLTELKRTQKILIDTDDTPDWKKEEERLIKMLTKTTDEKKKLQFKNFSFSNISDNFDEHIHKFIKGSSQLRDDIVSLSKYFIWSA